MIEEIANLAISSFEKFISSTFSEMVFSFVEGSSLLESSSMDLEESLQLREKSNKKENESILTILAIFNIYVFTKDAKKTLLLILIFEFSLRACIDLQEIMKGVKKRSLLLLLNLSYVRVMM